MLDNYIVQRKQNTTQNINIVERRAPTDDSIKLLHEMEEKAFDSIIKQIIVDDMVLKGMITYCSTNYPIQKLICIYSFMLNGRRYDIESSISFSDINTKTNKSMILDFYNTVSKEIAKQLLLTSENNELLSQEIEKCKY